MCAGAIQWARIARVVVAARVTDAEALGFGGGVAFLVAGRRAVWQTRSRLAFAAYLSTAWLLMAAWPHGNLHRSLGFDLVSIARIEWAIHLTVLLAAVVVALFVARSFAPRARYRPLPVPPP
jgi:hypothetical protein